MILYILAADERHGFPGGSVGEAEDHGIRAVERIRASDRIFAERRIDGDDRKVRAVPQPVADLNAGGTGLAVYEYGWIGHGWFPNRCVALNNVRVASVARPAKPRRVPRVGV